VYLAYPDRAPDTRTAARMMLGCRGWMVVHEMSQVLDAEVHHGRFDWVQLRTWQWAIIDDPLIRLISADIDERTNRPVFGVRSEEARTNFLRRVRALGIPSAAVHVAITEDPMPG